MPREKASSASSFGCHTPSSLIAKLCNLCMYISNNYPTVVYFVSYLWNLLDFVNTWEILDGVIRDQLVHSFFCPSHEIIFLFFITFINYSLPSTIVKFNTCAINLMNYSLFAIINISKITQNMPDFYRGETWEFFLLPSNMLLIPWSPFRWFLFGVAILNSTNDSHKCNANCLMGNYFAVQQIN